MIGLVTIVEITYGATIFALIVGLFSVYNGRMTRREISRLIISESEKTRTLIKEVVGELRVISERIEATLARMDRRLEIIEDAVIKR